MILETPSWSWTLGRNGLGGKQPPRSNEARDSGTAGAGSVRGVQLCGSIGSVELGVRLRLTESRNEEGR
jgi:hypothetical protein